MSLVVTTFNSVSLVPVVTGGSNYNTLARWLAYRCETAAD